MGAYTGVLGACQARVVAEGSEFKMKIVAGSPGQVEGEAVAYTPSLLLSLSSCFTSLLVLTLWLS